MILIFAAIFGSFNPILSIPGLVLIVLGMCGADSEAGDFCALLFLLGVAMFVASHWLSWSHAML